MENAWDIKGKHLFIVRVRDKIYNIDKTILIPNWGV